MEMLKDQKMKPIRILTSSLPGQIKIGMTTGSKSVMLEKSQSLKILPMPVPKFIADAM